MFLHRFERLLVEAGRRRVGRLVHLAHEVDHAAEGRCDEGDNDQDTQGQRDPRCFHAVAVAPGGLGKTRFFQNLK